MKSLQDLIRHLRSGEARSEDVLDRLADPSPLVRANALEALVSFARLENGLLGAFRAAAVSPQNQVRLMGTITVAHVAVGCALRVGGEKANDLAAELLAGWPEPDRSDLLWYLKSEHIFVQ